MVRIAIAAQDLVDDRVRVDVLRLRQRRSGRWAARPVRRRARTGSRTSIAGWSADGRRRPERRGGTGRTAACARQRRGACRSRRCARARSRTLARTRRARPRALRRRRWTRSRRRVPGRGGSARAGLVDLRPATAVVRPDSASVRARGCGRAACRRRSRSPHGRERDGSAVARRRGCDGNGGREGRRVGDGRRGRRERFERVAEDAVRLGGWIRFRLDRRPSVVLRSFGSVAPCLRSSPSSPARRSAETVLRGMTPSRRSFEAVRSRGLERLVNAWVSRCCAACGRDAELSRDRSRERARQRATTSASEAPRSSWSLTARTSSASTETVVPGDGVTASLCLPANSAATESPSWALKSAPPALGCAAFAPGRGGRRPIRELVRIVMGFRVSPPFAECRTRRPRWTPVRSIGSRRAGPERRPG